MLEIRPCAAGDFDEVFELLKQLWPDRILDPVAIRASYNRILRSDTQTYLCAADGGHLLAFGSLSIKGNLCQGGFMAYIDELVVDAAHRRSGIGTAITAALIDLAKRSGCRRIALDSAFHRSQAHAFYEKNGFERHGFLFSKMI